MSNEAKKIVLKNALVQWAHLIRPGRPYDEDQAPSWEVNIYPTAEDADLLMSHGVNPKTDKHGSHFWVAKRSTVKKGGGENTPPPLVDARKNPFHKELGNGSVCNIAVTLFDWERRGRRGIMLYLNAVQVVNYVAASSGTDAFDVIDVDGDDLSGL